MAVLLSPDRTRHAVSRLPPSRENPDGFHRLIGGGVEFGETAIEAVVREVQEELGAALVGPTLLGVLENIFESDGVPGHEVVFVFSGSLDPSDTIPPEGGMFADNDRPMPVEWRRVDDEDEPVPLYPSGVGPLVRRVAASVLA